VGSNASADTIDRLLTEGDTGSGTPEGDARIVLAAEGIERTSRSCDGRTRPGPWRVPRGGEVETSPAGRSPLGSVT